MSLLTLAGAAAAAPIRWTDLHLHPVALTLGPLQIRWYSLGYIAGILGGWWYLLKLLDRPGAPMARRHADDLVFYATLGILIGGRTGYVLFYDPWMLRTPWEVLRLWNGGMSFHGGALGMVAAIVLLGRRNGLSALRIHDYIACVAPIGIFLVRLANFVNGELWGRPATVPWAMVFPHTVEPGLPEPARHPSQLYEAGLEGILLFALLNWFFWRTEARYRPGFLLGLFLMGYGASRFIVEYFREPDVQLGILPWGLSMGQTLSFPMILVGLWFVATAARRRVRVEPIAGSASVA